LNFTFPWDRSDKLLALDNGMTSIRSQADFSMYDQLSRHFYSGDLSRSESMRIHGGQIRTNQRFECFVYLKFFRSSPLYTTA